MTNDTVELRRGENPLVPVYGFNPPGTPIVLYEGPIVGAAEDGARDGRIELNCGPRKGLRWHVDLHQDDHWLELGQPQLAFCRNGQDWTVDAHERAIGEGWINMASRTLQNARLHRVIVHWMNLPNILGQITLTDDTRDRKRWWRGRWRTDVAGWQLTLDVRPDHTQAMAGAHEAHLYLLTHVMEIRRVDDEAFDVATVQELLDCLRVTFSFAFGRWVAPVLPVGYASDGSAAWEMWTSPICDPAKAIGSPWLSRERPADLTDLVRCAVPAFRDSTRPGITRYQMYLAVQAVESGFIEQRILAAAPALEHLAWSNLVLSKRWTSQDYEDRYAEDRLRYVLQLAGIPTRIEPALLPSLTAFSRAKKLDGPSAITRVRNRLVHPQTPEDQVYKHRGLVQDVWKLSRYYVTLLLLRSIGYRGRYIDLIHGNGSESDTKPVPWDTPTPIGTPSMPPTKRKAQRRARSPRTR